VTRQPHAAEVLREPVRGPHEPVHRVATVEVVSRGDAISAPLAATAARQTPVNSASCSILSHSGLLTGNAESVPDAL
jgi:hypothetical protein